MILLPTKNRKNNVIRFIEHYNITKATEPVVVIVEEDDLSCDVSLPAHWIIRRYKNGNGAASHFNNVFCEFPNENYYAYIGDDVIPRTHRWDIELKSSAMVYGFSYPDDGENGQNFAPFGWIDGDLVRRVGKLNYLDLDHFGFDNFWFHLARSLRKIKYRGDVLLEHMHPRVGKAEIDSTYKPEVMQKTIKGSNPDSIKWKEFRKSDKWEELCLKCL